MDHQIRTSRWLTLGISTVAFYLLSFGPLYYALVSIGTMPPSFGQKVIRGITALYAPHFWMRDHVRVYYAYAGWWAELARPEKVVPPWDASRNATQDTLIY